MTRTTLSSSQQTEYGITVNCHITHQEIELNEFIKQKHVHLLLLLHVVHSKTGEYFSQQTANRNISGNSSFSKLRMYVPMPDPVPDKTATFAHMHLH